MRLRDRIAIVTGAASGFGRAIAEAFAREGAKVMIADVGGAGARDAAAAIAASAAAVTCDVARKADVEAMVAATVATFGGLDIVVNNAGTTHRNQSLLTVTEAEFDRIYAVNVKSIYLTTLACVPEMEKRGAASSSTRPRRRVCGRGRGSPGTMARRRRRSS